MPAIKNSRLERSSRKKNARWSREDNAVFIDLLKSQDVAAADTYMAITDERKRNQFIRGLLDMPVNEPDNHFL